jgi:hypothetical protein
MTPKEQRAWYCIKVWLQFFADDQEPWKNVPAADLLTLMHEAETEQPPTSCNYRFQGPEGWSIPFVKSCNSDKEAHEYANGLTDGPGIASIEKEVTPGVWFRWCDETLSFIP